MLARDRRELVENARPLRPCPVPMPCAGRLQLPSGLLTGKYRRNMPLPEEARLTKTQRLADRYLTEKNWATSEKLIDFAEARGRTPVELAFGWLLAQARVAGVIAGATKAEQVEENARAGAWRLAEDDLAEIDRITLD